jgi:hypothetical protein
MNQDNGPPVNELRDVEKEVSPDFMSKVARKIHRRTTANQFAALSWHLPKIVLVEMANVLTHLFGAVSGRKEQR